MKALGQEANELVSPPIRERAVSPGQGSKCSLLAQLQSSGFLMGKMLTHAASLEFTFCFSESQCCREKGRGVRRKRPCIHGQAHSLELCLGLSHGWQESECSDHPVLLPSSLTGAGIRNWNLVPGTLEGEHPNELLNALCHKACSLSSLHRGF